MAVCAAILLPMAAPQQSAAPKAQSEGFDLTAWSHTSDPMQGEVSELYVSADPKSEKPEEQVVLNGSFFVGADGVVHFVSKPGADKSAKEGESKKSTKTPGIDVYRRKNRMAVANLDGTWKPLDLLDCEPETLTDSRTSSFSKFSRKLIDAVGGPPMPNGRASDVQAAARFEDPRILVKNAQEASKSAVGVQSPAGASPTTLSVDMPKDLATDFVGKAFPVDAVRITLKLDAANRVEEAVVSIRFHWNQCTDASSAAYWNGKQVYRHLSSAKSVDVPPESRRSRARRAGSRRPGSSSGSARRRRLRPLVGERMPARVDPVGCHLSSSKGALPQPSEKTARSWPPP
jgi:hypothetical protein